MSCGAISFPASWFQERSNVEAKLVLSKHTFCCHMPPSRIRNAVRKPCWKIYSFVWLPRDRNPENIWLTPMYSFLLFWYSNAPSHLARHMCLCALLLVGRRNNLMTLDWRLVTFGESMFSCTVDSTHGEPRCNFLLHQQSWLCSRRC